MAKEPLKITIDDVEYTEDQFDDQQKALINHIMDLDRKAASMRFNLDQLAGGREFFMAKLKDSLVEVVED